MPPPKHHAQCHQNKTAFKHNPNSQYTAQILAIPNCGLCDRCHEIIEWRKRYRKYKPIKTPAKCLHCAQKNVKFAYHQWCADCSYKAKICPKCLQSRDIVQAPVKALDEEAITQLLNGAFIKERRRRVIMRKWEAGELTDMELRDMIAAFNEEGAAAGGFDLGDDEDGDDDSTTAVQKQLAATTLTDASTPSQSSTQSESQSSNPAPTATEPTPTSKPIEEFDEDDDDFEDDEFSDDD